MNKRDYILEKITRIGLISLIYISASLMGFHARCGEIPLNWPWHGMVMTSTTADERDVPKISALLDANFLSLQIKPRLRAKRENITYTEALERELLWAEKILDRCMQHGLTAIIVMYQFPMDPQLGIKQNTKVFWHNTLYLDEVIAVSKKVSSRFSNRGSELSGYQFLSEPIIIEDGESVLPKPWPILLNRIIRTIRKEDPECWIAVSPGPGGDPIGYKSFERLPYKRILYNFHMYKPHAFTHQGVGNFPLGPKYPGRVKFRYWDKNNLEKSIAVVRKFHRNNDVPIFIGEFGSARWAEGGEQYILDLVAIFNSYGWGWAYHAYSGSHVWNPHYDTGYTINERSEIEKHYVGTNTLRWETLRKAFKIKANVMNNQTSK